MARALPAGQEAEQLLVTHPYAFGPVQREPRERRSKRPDPRSERDGAFRARLFRLWIRRESAGQQLTAAAYFTAATADETELRALADRLYRRVDWCWAQRKGAAVAMGWKPESGFLKYRREGYSEALLLFTLGLGSPTHPLTEASFAAWTRTYRRENH